MGMIGFAIVQVPKMSNELIENISKQSIYARALYRPKNANSRHVLICGELKSTALNEFFDELFHEDHANEDIHAVILQNGKYRKHPLGVVYPTFTCSCVFVDPPSREMMSILDDPVFSVSLTYLQGSALVEKDLGRALADKVVAVFIMCHKFSANPDEEDAKTILQQFSIRRYILTRSPTQDTLFCMQLVRPENRRHLTASMSSSSNGVSDNSSQDIVACMNEIKMGVIAKAVMAPGTSTMIMNLLASFSDEFGDDDEVEVDAEVDQLEDEDNSNWVDEYKRGCDWEIYTTELSDIFVGWRFSTLSDYLYQKLGIVLFGLQMEDLNSAKAYTRTLLNPGDLRIPSRTEMKIEAFVLAKNKSQSDLTFADGSMDGTAAVGAEAKQGFALGTVSNLNFLRSHIGGNTMRAPVGSTEQDHHHNSHHDGGLLDDNGEEEGTKKVFPWQQLLRKYGDVRPSAFTHQEAIQKAEDIHLRDNYYVRVSPADIVDCIVKTSVTEEIPSLEKMNNHVIIMGKSLSNLYDLIRPLRSRQLGTLRYIVILYAGDIPHAVWQRISIFEGILVVRGSFLEEADIRRAGIFQAQKVIILADAAVDVGGSRNGNSNIETLVDADAIFSYQCVRRMNEAAHVVAEIVKHGSIGYLDQEFSLASGEVHYRFTPQFASGALFTSSLLDTIVCQAYYNPLIIKVVNKLISGIEHKDYNEIAASAGTTQIKPRGLAAVMGSSLYQIPIPDDLESHTFGALFKHLAKSDMIPLGIFRGVFQQMKTGPKANKMSYVFTNPPKDTELFSCDKVFVLSQKSPFLEKKKVRKSTKVYYVGACYRGCMWLSGASERNAADGNYSKETQLD
jgi:hypothetical protein